jgi:hypothetical protein
MSFLSIGLSILGAGISVLAFVLDIYGLWGVVGLIVLYLLLKPVE